MILHITMKNPEALSQIEKQIRQQMIDGLDDYRPGTHDALEEQVDDKVESVTALLKKWFRYSEYATLCIDTDEETCTVETA